MKSLPSHAVGLWRRRLIVVQGSVEVVMDDFAVMDRTGTSSKYSFNMA